MIGTAERFIVACMTLVAVAGCHSGEPSGQVVARVNGEDITRRDVEAELANADVDQAQVVKLQPLIVDRIVSRKLLAAEADREGLDKSPYFLAAERRAHDMILIDMLQQRDAAASKPTDPAAVRAFIDANPQMFAGRRIIKVDQIKTAAAGLDAEALRPINNMGDIISYLNAHNEAFVQAPTTIDTGTLARDVVRRIDSVPAGMPFLAIDGGTASINVVTGFDPAPVPAEQQTAVALKLMREQAMRTFLDSKLKDLRRSANLQYQPGFAPLPSKAPAKSDVAGGQS